MLQSRPQQAVSPACTSAACEFSEPNMWVWRILWKRLSMFDSFPSPSQVRCGIPLPLLPTPDNLLISDTSTDAARHQKGSMSGRKRAAQSWQVIKCFKYFEGNQKFGFPAVPKQSAAVSRNCFAASSQKRQRGQKG